MSRYIDVDKLEKNLRKYADKKCQNQDIEIANGILKAVSFIKQQSTADVKEVIRGKWIAESDYFNCSVCGNSYDMECQDKYNYCPNCGTNMREE